MPRRLAALVSVLTVAIVTAIAGAGTALADTTASSNWAGYAVHHAGVRFTRVVGAWTQPTTRCVPGQPTYSAMWVGLGGYSGTSNALEQIGTEVDCTGSGHVSSTAWFELVPAASQPISMRVAPGDRIAASVIVTGHTVTLALEDETAHHSFARKFHARSIDVSSAEWIVEAPSECFSASDCRTLPLADFGSASFGLAAATAVGGHTGTIGDRAWQATRIRLTPAGRVFVSSGGSPVLGGATTSALAVKGTAFRVRFAAVSPGGSQVQAVSRRSSVRAGYLLHPRRG